MEDGRYLPTSTGRGVLVSLVYPPEEKKEEKRNKESKQQREAERRKKSKRQDKRRRGHEKDESLVVEKYRNSNPFFTFKFSSFQFVNVQLFRSLPFLPDFRRLSTLNFYFQFSNFIFIIQCNTKYICYRQIATELPPTDPKLPQNTPNLKQRAFF